MIHREELLEDKRLCLETYDRSIALFLDCERRFGISSYHMPVTFPGGIKMTSRQPFECSVYTIVHKNKLAEAVRNGGTITVREEKAWTTGYDLFCKAQATGAEMPVVFADATD